MIFTNPSGAPELACDECGCRWFDRMTGACYECGAEVTPEAREAFRRALEAFAANRSGELSCAAKASTKVTNILPKHSNGERS